MSRVKLPRVIIAGLAGDSGKTLVSLGLAGALKSKGLSVAPFKKGPDFIDAAWLTAAAGADAHNLDTFLMPEDAILNTLSRASATADIAIIEGNRGVFDGMDAEGTHSTAQLSKLTGAPTVLVIDANKTTRTVAALALGCQTLDPDLPIAGVILNRIGTARQEKIIREAVQNATGLPVLGAIPKLKTQHLPSRHLGLLPAAEHPHVAEALENVTKAVLKSVDVESIINVSRTASTLNAPNTPPIPVHPASPIRIGILKDKAFSFYYPDNLRSLQDEGAKLIPLSPLEDPAIPDLDGLYAGGGFPEVYARELAANRAFRESLNKQISEGLPVWAECGGLMYLSQALLHGGDTHPMVGALPVVVEQTERPRGHGYVMARVDTSNPFLKEGLELKGHEFHYSHVKDGNDLETVLSLSRGVGVGNGRDGIKLRNVVASYTHIHALGTPDWAAGFARAARGDSQ